MNKQTISAEELWEELVTTHFGDLTRPFNFDPDTYLALNSDVRDADIDPIMHYIKFGQSEGRHSTLWELLSTHRENIVSNLRSIITDERLRPLIDSDDPKNHQLVFELMALGDPLDKSVSSFSASVYHAQSPELLSLPINVPPVCHFLVGEQTSLQYTTPDFQSSFNIGQFEDAESFEFDNDEPSEAGAEFDPDAYWKKVAKLVPGLLDRRPRYDFDPEFYARTMPEFEELGMSPEDHYEYMAEQLPDAIPGNNWQSLKNMDGFSVNKFIELITEPKLKKAVRNDAPGAVELAYELISFGEPLDTELSTFSCSDYLWRNTDVREAGVEPLCHFLVSGYKENRHVAVAMEHRQFEGSIKYDPKKPTCLIASHESSRTGAPIVALHLAKQASKTHNVVITSLAGGPLAEGFVSNCSLYIESGNPLEELPLYDQKILSKVDFAIVNSVAAWPFIRYLLSENIPFASYLHEFGTYYYLPNRFIPLVTALCSDLLVFSSEAIRDSWNPVFKDIGFDVANDSLILPQEQLNFSSVDPKKYKKARDLIGRKLGIEIRPDQKIVLGAGHMQLRKGCDLFAITSQLFKKSQPNTIFLWVGDGRNMDDLQFGVYLEKHWDEAAGSDITQRNLHYLPAGPYYLDAMAAADVFFLPSRLDPLPNVIFDAAKANCQIILFKGATGFDDQRYDGIPKLKRIEYGNVAAAAATISEAALKSKNTPLKSEIESVDLFEVISNKLEQQITTHGKLNIDNVEAAEAPMYDTSTLYLEKGEKFRRYRAIERSKMWHYDRHWLWKSADEARTVLENSDNWVHKAIRIVPWRDTKLSNVPSYNLHIHAFYLDGLEDDLLTRPVMRSAKRIVVTTDSEKKADTIRNIGKMMDLDIETELVPNVGRDILPFLVYCSGSGGGDDDEVWCHVHQKKSAGVMRSAETWRSFLLNNLFGSPAKELASEPTLRVSAAAEIANKKDCGFVAPFDPLGMNWTDSHRIKKEFDARLAEPLPQRLVAFPIGNMFFARTRVVRRMLEFIGRDYPWPNEPIANDGTIFHYIERVWPAVCAMEGLSAVFMEKADEDRISI